MLTHILNVVMPVVIQVGGIVLAVFVGLWVLQELVED
jgi:phage-related protein